MRFAGPAIRREVSGCHHSHRTFWLNARMRRVLLIVIVSVLAWAGVAAARGPSPIIPANRPTPLADAVNGVVSPARLVGVAAHCITAREAGPSLARIFAMARQARVGLGADECYRTLPEGVTFANQAAQP